MDETKWADEEDVMITVSLCRGRESQPDTRRYSSFTCQQLDAIAPLSRKDRLSIRDGMPTNHAREMIRRRIAVARSLKYRTQP